MRAAAPLHRASFHIASPPGPRGDRVTAAVRAALDPEVADSMGGPRARLGPGARRSELELEIEAETLSSLRAAVNSHLRAASLAVASAGVGAPASEEE